MVCSKCEEKKKRLQKRRTETKDTTSELRESDSDSEPKDTTSELSDSDSEPKDTTSELSDSNSETGKKSTQIVRALGVGQDHRAFQPRPIYLGVSGSVDTDQMPGFCCGGTLGCLVQFTAGGILYRCILSNMHVLAQDTVLGLNNRVRAFGDWILQPGLIDTGCNLPIAPNGVPTNAVGQLLTWTPIVEYNPSNPVANVVDCAMGGAGAGLVRTDGAILDFGYTYQNPVTAYVGLLVRKSGRTTDVTYGTVTAIGVTILVGYTRECGGASYAALFTNQIQIQGSAFTPVFSNFGDSGSLVLTQQATPTPGSIFQSSWPVGLLFAGGNGFTFANPIANVLSSLGVTLVGTPAAPFVPLSLSTASTESDPKSVIVEMPDDAIDPTTVKLFNDDDAFVRFQMRSQRAIKTKDDHISMILNLPHCIGAAITPDKDGKGEPVIQLYLTESDTSVTYPSQIGGFPVSSTVLGQVQAL